MTAKFGAEDTFLVTAAAKARVTASGGALSTDRKLNWRMETEFDPNAAFEVLEFRSALIDCPGLVNDGVRFSHLQYVVNTAEGQKSFERPQEHF